MSICAFLYLSSIITLFSMIPTSIVGSHKFYDTLVNFLGLIGYYAGAFGAIVLVEHFVFRGGSFASYDLEQWNKPRKLPWGTAALAAGILSFALVIPCMDQVRLREYFVAFV